MGRAERAEQAVELHMGVPLRGAFWLHLSRRTSLPVPLPYTHTPRHPCRHPPAAARRPLPAADLSEVVTRVGVQETEVDLVDSGLGVSGRGSEAVLRSDLPRGV